MINVQFLEGLHIARISGEIDMANIGHVEDEITRHVKSEANGYVLDLSEVTYLDSAGIRMIYQLDERARDRQQHVIVVVPTEAQINRTLEAAGVIGSLRIYTTTDEALLALRDS